MGVVNTAIEDGVGVSGVANSRMPSRQGKLRGDDRRPAPVAVFEDYFEQIVTTAGVEGLEAEVVEDQEIGAAEGFQEARMTPVAARERQLFAELGPAMVDDGAVVAAGLRAADAAIWPARGNGARVPIAKKAERARSPRDATTGARRIRLSCL